MMTSSRPLLLVSNDDGIHFDGLRALTAACRHFDADVLVVAPLHHQSGMASAISVGKPLRAYDIEHEQGYDLYAVDGTPADCMKYALNVLLVNRRPTLVLSGVNHGYNHSANTMYSGTMGAAFEAASHGLPAVAFSIGIYERKIDFTPSLPTMVAIIGRLLERPLRPGIALNVNLPATPPPYSGIKATTTALGYWQHELQRQDDPYGRECHWLVSDDFVLLNPEDDIEGTRADAYWLERGWVTATPCHVDPTAYAALDHVDHLLEGLNANPSTDE